MEQQQILVQLVNEHNIGTGVMEKMTAHAEGRLHRAVSVFIFNSSGRLLLQKRAAQKYHSAGLWSNSCCTHPLPGESSAVAATRRLQEEMGFTCRLHHQFDLIYKADVGNGLTEYEFDEIFCGCTDDMPRANPHEVAEWYYASPDDINNELKANPGNFTAWFPILFNELKKHL